MRKTVLLLLGTAFFSAATTLPAENETSAQTTPENAKNPSEAPHPHAEAARERLREMKPEQREEMRQRRMEFRKKMLERFDADGDGKLSDSERKTMRETLKEEGFQPPGRSGEPRGPGGPRDPAKDGKNKSKTDSE